MPEPDLQTTARLIWKILIVIAAAICFAIVSMTDGFRALIFALLGAVFLLLVYIDLP
jgi:hypothetical protein